MRDKFEKLTKIRRRRLLKGMAGAGAASMAGCIDQFGEEEGGTLNFAQVKKPVQFDPVTLNDVPSAEVADQIFEGLYEYDESTGHVPALATGDPDVSKESTRFVVEIEGDAEFQNGDPVTAEDVKHSFDALVDEETENANEVSMVNETSVVDDKTVQFDLDYAYAPFTFVLHRSIVPKGARTEDTEDFKHNPIGSGAFEFSEWEQGNYVELTAYDDYWGDKQPNLDGIRFEPITEGTTRMTELQNEDKDVIKEIPPDLWSKAQNIDGASVQDVAGTGYFYLAFNCKEGPTTDPKVREAIDYCFDMDQAVSSFVEPTGVRQYSPYPKSISEDWDFPLDEWENAHNDKNIDEAQSLFEEAGVPDDYSWRIIVPPDDKREEIGVTVANGLQEAGFSNTEVQRLDWGAFLEQYISGNPDDYNMYTLGWAGVPDPDSFAYFLLSRAEDTLGITNGTYWGEHSEKGVTASEKFIQAREATDQETRRQLYIEGTDLVMEDKPHIPAYNLKNSFGVQDYVEDFHPHPTAQFQLFSDHNNVSKTQ